MLWNPARTRLMEVLITTTTASSVCLVYILVRAATGILSHVYIYIPLYHGDENSLWLPPRKVVMFSQKEASMLICGENVNSCSVQRRAQTHLKRFHTFACDAVGLQCWVNVFFMPNPQRHRSLQHQSLTTATWFKVLQ